MKHKTIITRLCYSLNQGCGINSALAELNLTPVYLERLRRSDRAKLHQARAIYVEGLQREIVNRARLGRATGQLERALDNLPLLTLPGDDEDQEREFRRNSKDDDGVIIDEGSPSLSLSNLHLFLGNTQIVDEDEDDESEDKPEKDPPRRPRKHLPPDKPAEEAPAAPRSTPQASDTPFAALSRRPPEDANQRPPEPDPALHWVRLFTGRAVLRDEDGKTIRSVMPGVAGYPREHQFINWE